MAKVTGPLMSISASGQFGESIVYASWKGIQYARSYFIPANPRTASQQVFRGYFKSAVEAWQAEASSIKQAWNTYVKNAGLAETGFNFYVGKYCTFMAENSGTPPTVTNTPPNMS